MFDPPVDDETPARPHKMPKLILKPGRLNSALADFEYAGYLASTRPGAVYGSERYEALMQADRQALLQVIRDLGREAAVRYSDTALLADIDHILGLEVVEESNE